MPARSTPVALVLCLVLLTVQGALPVTAAENGRERPIIRVTGTEGIDFGAPATTIRPKTSGRTPGLQADITVVEETVTVKPSDPSNPAYALTQVLGEIRNDHDFTVFIGSLMVAALDDEDQLLGVVRASVPAVPPCELLGPDWNLLGPGESTPFAVTMGSAFSEIETIAIRAIGTEFSRDPCPTTLELTEDWVATETAPGRSKLTGTVRNHNTTDIVDLRISVAARDSSNAVVALVHQYPWSEVIGGYTGGLRTGDEIAVSLHLNVSVDDLQSLSLESRITGRPYQGGSFRYGVVGIAHGPGANGSLWRSSLTLTNLSGAPARAILSYFHAGARVDASVEIETGTEFFRSDVARSLFGVNGKSAGYLQITSSAPLTVTGRTSNEAILGGFGQSLPVYTPEMTGDFWFGDLSGLRGGEAFRTNIGLVNMAITECSCEVRVFRLDGSLLREFDAVELDETDWKQLNNVLPDDVDVAFATVDPGQGCLMWAYASVIEESTGDPTTIEVEPATIIDLAPWRGAGLSFGGWPDQSVPEP